MKEIFFRNLRLKVIAVAFSVALWFFVAGQSSTEVALLVPLGIKGAPGALVMTSAPPGEVEVRLSGPRLLMSDLSPSQVQAELDLGMAKEGLNTYRITRDNIVAPAGVEVKRLKPNSVKVTMERMVRLSLPVKVRLKGSPAAGFRVRRVIVTPESVEASGIGREIREMEGLFTRPVDVTGLDYSTTVSAQIDVSGHELKEMSAERVSVRIIIERGQKG
jgi:YbbR domain-containing protein